MSTTITMSTDTPAEYKMPIVRNRRHERATRARNTITRDIPDLLRTCPRAKHGIQNVTQIVDPPRVPQAPLDSFAPMHRQDLKIRIVNSDTLNVAARMSVRPFAVKRTAPTHRAKPEGTNVCVLNMGSAHRPGGGFLDGANSQEEFLCARTTLYTSLWDSFYPLRDVSAIWSPDVLVFRNSEIDADDVQKRDRYFIDVISSSMLKFGEAMAEGCSCGVSFCDRHRDLVVRKMRAVMRAAQMKGAEKLVLGAWGCGAYGNPVHEIAKAWRKVIVGAQRSRKPNVERWEGIKEITFAIPDQSMLREFELAFKDVLCRDSIERPSEEDRVDSSADLSRFCEHHDEISDLITRIAAIEADMESHRFSRQRQIQREQVYQLRR